MVTSDESSATRAEPTWQRLTPSASPDVVYQTDREGVVTWVSDDVHQLLGWAASELVGTHSRDLIHDDLERIDQVRSTVLSGTAQNDVTCRFRTRTGAYRGCSLRARPLVDVDDSVIGSIVVVRDVHDSSAAARALVTLSRGNRVLVRARDQLELLRDMCTTVVEAGQYLFAWYGRPRQDAEQTIEVTALAGAAGDYLDDIRISWGDNVLGRGPTGIALARARRASSTTSSPTRTTGRGSMLRSRTGSAARSPCPSWSTAPSTAHSWSMPRNRPASTSSPAPSRGPRRRPGLRAVPDPAAPRAAGRIRLSARLGR